MLVNDKKVFPLHVTFFVSAILSSYSQHVKVHFQVARDSMVPASFQLL